MNARLLVAGWPCLALSCSAGAPAPALAPPAPDLALVEPGDRTVDLRELERHARLTVLVFFSPHCHCLTVHEPRLAALDEEYAPRGVAFYLVDSESSASRERDDREAAARALPFPILLDRGGRLAAALDAQYATYSVVLDAEGRVAYRGGIDTDKTHLRADATPYLKDALDDLLAGRPPRVASGKALGCALERW